jgi:hypothetical protein
VDIKDSKGVPMIQIDGSDLSRMISRNKVVNFYQSALSANYTDIIRKMCSDQFPGCVFDNTAAAWRQIPPAGIAVNNSNVISTDSLVPLLFQEGADLWAEAQNLANSLACDLYFNRDGTLVFKQDPNMTWMNGNLPTLPNPSATFIEGSQARFVNLDRKLSDSAAYNQVIVTGEGQIIGASQNPIRSVPARDTDVKSPTYINGDYGTVTLFETNSYMKTQNQVNNFAQWRLKTSIGSQEAVQFDGFVDSALDIDDILLLTRSRMGLVNQLFVLDAYTVPLTSKEVMQVRLRERRAIV